jgi:hypothetical protein
MSNEVDAIEENVFETIAKIEAIYKEQEAIMARMLELIEDL